MVGFAHDGSDISARIISQKLTQIWDQQVIVENRPGAAVNIGADAVVNDEVQLSFGAQSAFDAFI